MQKPGIQSINATSKVLTQFRSQNPFGVFTWNFTFRAQIWYGTLTVVIIFWWPANAVCFMAINLHNLMNANIARKYVDNRHLDNAVHIIINVLVIKTGITDETLKSYHVENENDMIWCYWSNPYMTFCKVWKHPGGCLNIKMSSYQYRDSHFRDKTVSLENTLLKLSYSLMWHLFIKSKCFQRFLSEQW